MPRKYPETWKNSRFCISDNKYYLTVTISLLAYITVFIDSMRNLIPIATIVSLSFLQYA
ncbi:MAG: hypothetical protein RIN55_06810 [Tissierellaceae bacterium]|nr:hypothetical protein [Tissierellaceae bacterium]